MEIIQAYIINNLCYQANIALKPKGLILHSVGTPQPSAEIMARLYNVAKPGNKKVAVHAFLQADGKVYQTMPWDRLAWHGAGAVNTTHIGIEMTEPSQIKYISGANFTCVDTASAIAQVKGTYATAVDLFAMLCKQYNLDPLADGVIMSHYEAGCRKMASEHADPEHLWKGLKLPYTMDGFRQDVKKRMGGTINIITSTANSINYNIYIKKFQAWLNTNYKTGLSIDGEFGPKTKLSAVKALQTALNTQYKAGLGVDGEFGPKTKSACAKANLKQGSKGNLVYILQGLLYSYKYDCNGFDGDFGAGCAKAVRNYQSTNKLEVDGIVGSNTWQSLCK